MSQAPNTNGPVDRAFINLSEDKEVKYWKQTLGVSYENLRRAMRKVGNSANKVREELARQSAPAILARGPNTPEHTRPAFTLPPTQDHTQASLW